MKKRKLTLKQMERAYQEAKVFDKLNNDMIYPKWKYWIYKFQPWKYREVMKGVFLVK